MTEFSPAVLARLNTCASSTPIDAAPARIEVSLADRSVGTLATWISPSWMATTSVKVPPTSTPSISAGIYSPTSIRVT